VSISEAEGGGVQARVVLPFHTARDLKTHGI
jgi:hypothetical protein